MGICLIPARRDVLGFSTNKKPGYHWSWKRFDSVHPEGRYSWGFILILYHLKCGIWKKHFNCGSVNINCLKQYLNSWLLSVVIKCYMCCWTQLHGKYISSVSVILHKIRPGSFWFLCLCLSLPLSRQALYLYLPVFLLFIRPISNPVLPCFT